MGEPLYGDQKSFNPRGSIRVGLHDRNMLRFFQKCAHFCYMLRLYEKYVTVFVTIFSKNVHIFKSRRKMLGFCVYSFEIAQFLGGPYPSS